MKKYIALTLVILSIAISGCAKSESTKNATKLEVSFDSDKGCSEKSFSAPSGMIEIAGKNTGSSVGELEVLDGDRIKGEAENIISGTTKTFSVKLEVGEYEFYCGKKQAARSALIVTKNANADSDKNKISAEIKTATEEYKKYVIEQGHLLTASVKTLTDAVRNGDVKAAQVAFAPSREPFERIEPIAELFAKYDASIDSRVDDFLSVDDPEFTGFHRIEYSIFELNSTEGLTVFADKLDSDVSELNIELAKLDVDPFDMAKGPQLLMEEIANGKITGEEDRYSGTDLSDFNANIVGSKVIVDLLRVPLLDVKSNIPQKFDAAYTKIIARLDKYRNDDGTYQHYKNLTEQDKAQFKADVAQASETLADIPGDLNIG